MLKLLGVMQTTNFPRVSKGLTLPAVADGGGGGGGRSSVESVGCEGYGQTTSGDSERR